MDRPAATYMENDCGIPNTMIQVLFKIIIIVIDIAIRCSRIGTNNYKQSSPQFPSAGDSGKKSNKF